MTTNLRRGVASVIATSALMTAGTLVAAEPQSTPDVRIDWGVRFHTRDGVELAANVYRPGSAPDEKRPAILTLTPYGADRYHGSGMFFASHGYAFVIVDVRGRGNSGGEFWPYEKDGVDGSAAIAWITSRPWSNGKVGMWGGSAAGYNQWATLKEFPPGLVTIVPTASAYPGFELPPSFKNIYSGWSLNWLSSVAGRTLNSNLEGDIDYWTQVFRSHYLAMRPFDQLDEHAGMHLAAFDRWLAHPHLDEYWDAFVPGPDAYRRIDIPILTITGHYDGVQRGALEYERLHMQYGTDTGKARHFVVIGPWNHAGTRHPQRNIGGVEFGDRSLVDIDQLHLDWYDWTMRNGPRPAFLADRINYYVEEADEWRSASAMDKLGTRVDRLYLGPSGSLGETKGAAATVGYLYDPRDTRAGAAEPAYGPKYLLDQSRVTNLFGAGLVFETAPFAADVMIVGKPRAGLWIDIDAPDTDLELVLYQLLPDGKSIELAQDQMRVRYRESLRSPVPAPMHRVLDCTFPDFQFFARRLERGSRLRLLIRAPNSIYTQKNYNSGGDVARESGADARSVRVNVHLGGTQASALDLPVVAAAR